MMTPQQRSEIGKMWFHLAKTFKGIELEDGALRLLLNSVEELPFEKVKSFMVSWLKENTQPRHPYPAEIHSACGFKKVDNKSLALEATNRINEAVIKFGEFDAVPARAFIGELGWRAIQRRGGWSHLCATHGATLDVDTFTAQTRDFLIATLELKDAGQDDQPIMLDRKTNTGHLTQVANINFLDLITKTQEKKDE